MREIFKTKKRILIFVLAIVLFFVIVMLISNIVSTNISLEKIKENAKREVERALISSGLAVYTGDIENNDVGAGPVSAHNENLPQNTAENPQNMGTIVASNANWNIETVTAVSVGNGDTVPVPKGFYYVGGDLSTGVIISDDERDKYDGTTDKTTWEYTTSLKGNQFVWIPCTEEEYKKCEVWNDTTQTPTTLANSGWDKMTYTSELPQIRKYGGFYVARYEAGLAETIPEFTTAQIGSSKVYNQEGIPQSKANKVPWNFIDWATSQKNAKNMYNTSSVSSGLITGAQWDVMLKQMVARTDLTEADLTSSEKWGNYINTSIEYKGRIARANYSDAWYLLAFGGETEGKTSSYNLNNGDLLTTGASRQTERYHIFDVAGNLWERTEESSLYKAGNANETNAQNQTVRGGGYCDISGQGACYRRGEVLISTSAFGIGFRVVLYIK